jgi:aspartyl-tRNA(Asn)/glutamyl-tRNA(Gln) amidotransferase subunit C
MGGIRLKIEKEAEIILEKFSKALKNIPELEETHYMVDNVNLARKDKGREKNPEKILRNAQIDEEGNLIVEKGKWVR